MKNYLLLFISLLVFQTGLQSQYDSTTVIALRKKVKGFEKTGEQDSIFYYEKISLDIARKINYKKGIAHSAGVLGHYYLNKGDFPKALDYLFNALKFYEELGSKNGISVQLANIATIYDSQGDYRKSLDYNERALKIAESNGDTKLASTTLSNMGIVYSKLNDFGKAKTCILKALSVDNLSNDKEGIARNLINIGYIHSEKRYDKEALNYFIKALEMSKELGDKDKIATCLVNIGMAYSSLKDYQNAEKYLTEALRVAAETGDINLMSQLEYQATEFYTENDKDKEAFVHYKKHISLRDSVYNEENTKNSVKSEMNYEFEKKAAAIKYEHDIQVLKLESDNLRQKQLRIFLIVLLVLLVMLLIVAKRAYDAKKNKAEFMATENNRKEVLLQEVHHRINNNLQIISSLLTLQANSVEDEKLNEYLKQSQNRIQSLAALHELLYQNDSPLQINMRHYLNKVLDFHRDILKTLSCKVTMEVNVTEASFPTKLAVPVALIVNELVTNAIKYAFQGKETGRIRVSLEPFLNEIDTWVLGVNDNGKGLPVDDVLRKDSLGIKLVTILSKQIKGSITKNNSPGASFEIVFSKPQ